MRARAASPTVGDHAVGQPKAAEKWTAVLVTLSVALLFFSVPHTLEDFAAGEPQKKGIPAPLLALVVSGLFAAQAAGLFWLGRGARQGAAVHLALGVIWPLAAGLAQLPEIFGPGPYRAGFISVAYVVGLVAIGPAVAITSGLLLRSHASATASG